MSMQPEPVPNLGPNMWQLVAQEYREAANQGVPFPGDTEGVLADMAAREQLGRERYGTTLQAYNGRNAMRDAYEEALDLTVYLRQALAEAPDEQDAKLIVHYGVVTAMLGDLRGRALDWEAQHGQ